jgi:hypothetical protein
MKTLVIAIAIAVAGLSTAAVAQGRLSTTAMSCGAAHSLVVQRGAVVLGTGGQTFDRVVRDTSFCFGGQKLRPVIAPTRDNPQCYVGDRCFDESLDPR